MADVIRFTKMHGVGNDYIYVEEDKYRLDNPSELAVKWSKAHFGIGADGLVLIGSSEDADFSMKMFNADGSEGWMCGNAVRCIGKYVYERGLHDSTVVRLDTRSGIKELNLNVIDGEVVDVAVDMGVPAIGETLIIDAEGRAFMGLAVSMGNPHFVIFVDDIDTIDVAKYGAVLEHNHNFRHGANIEFVSVLAPDKLRVRVWERGSGITMACGTGACASAVAAIHMGKTTVGDDDGDGDGSTDSGGEITVQMDGGELSICWDEEDTGDVFMTGGATFVFDGTITI
ncbi:MAG: diaminopimelate epimerase [Tannerellaceae bacterium]|jgi:diaminopimelate epimerase|nr:diaminopimelate epimerase [Tannerellaceae bacterium]